MGRGQSRRDGRRAVSYTAWLLPRRSDLVGCRGLRLPGAAGQLVWLDAETYEITRVKDSIHDGHTVAAALSPNRTRIATGSSDGFVRVWHSETGELLHEIPLNGIAIQGVAFVDEYHLAVAPAEGDLLLVTTDPDELIELVRGSLTRGFDVAECERFNFDDNCPTLNELRGSATP